MGEHAVSAKHHLADLRWPWQGAHHHICLCHGLRNTGCERGAQGHQIGCLGCNGVEDSHVVASAKQIRRHRVAHVANADKGQSWQLTHDFLNVKNCGLSPA